MREKMKIVSELDGAKFGIIVPYYSKEMAEGFLEAIRETGRIESEILLRTNELHNDPIRS